MWGGPRFAVVILLVGGISNMANAQIGWFGRFGIVEIAEVGVSKGVETFVKETTLDDECRFAVDKLLGDILRIEFSPQAVSAEPGGRENHLPDDIISAFLTAIKEGRHSSQRGAAFLVFVGLHKALHGREEILRGFMSGIRVFDANIDRLPNFDSAVEFGISRPYPCTFGRYQVVAGGLGGIGHRGSLFLGGFSLFSSSFSQPSVRPDKLICLLRGASHFRELPLHNVSLLSGIASSDNDSGDADASRDPKTKGFKKFEPKFPALQPESQFFYTAVKGICALGLIFGSVGLLGYSLKRTDYLLAVGALCGFLPFALGIVLLFSVFGLIH
jgi:hypothetical protein